MPTAPPGCHPRSICSKIGDRGLLLGARMTVPFYQDWTFWSAVAAVVAIVLSQLPPVHVLLKRGALDVEVYNRLAINHRVGIPLAQLHLIVRNTGGRTLKVTGMDLVFERDGNAALELPAQGYFANPGDKEAVLLTTFTLQPKAEWGHIVNFFKPLPRGEERALRQLESNLRADIADKRSHLEDKSVNVEADAANVQPLVDLSNARLPWQPGDYTVTIRVRTTPAARIPEAKYRAVVFESDSTELRNYADGYKFGFGVLFPVPDQGGVLVAISKL